MGDAKRRKQLDPNFGKDTCKYHQDRNEKWYQQMLGVLPSNYLPDFGHFYLKQFGSETPFTLYIHCPKKQILCYVKEKSKIMFAFKSHNHLGSILVSKKLWTEIYTDKPVFLSLIPDVKDRYYQNRQWVIPMIPSVSSNE